MRWPFSRVSPEVAPPLTEPPRLWAPGWDVECFASSGQPRWCGAATVYEVLQLRAPQTEYRERRLFVLPGNEVYVDQQGRPPIRETASLLATIDAGKLVFFPPSGSEVFRLGVVYTVSFEHSWLSPVDLALDVADVQGQLNGEASRLEQCRAALVRWAANPDDAATQVLRERYDATSTLTRRYLMGMDAKDNGVRWFFEARTEQEREMHRDALLAACRVYADEIGAPPTRR